MTSTMRLLVPSLSAALPAKWLLVGVLALACASGGCEGEPEGSTAVHDGGPPFVRPDASCEPILCRTRGFLCRGGDVVQLEATITTACENPTLACPEGDVVRTCERGCTEGAIEANADLLCLETRPKVPGDPCTTTEECRPWRDGALGCDVPRGMCVLIGRERCNGFDDDVDATVDEGCDCHPRLLSTVPHDTIAVDAAFGAEGIAVLASDGAGGTAALLDADGVVRASHDELPYGRRIAHVNGEWVAVLQHGATGTSTLVRLHEDGSDSRVTLQRTAPGERTWVVGDGEGWILMTPVRSMSLGVTRHAATGERLAWQQATGVFDVAFVTAHAGETLVGLVGGFPLGRLGADLSFTAAEIPPDAISPLDATIAGGSLLVVASTPEGFPAIVERDASGTFGPTRPIPETDYFGRGTRIAATRAGDRIAIAWFGYDGVEGIVLRSDDLTRVGEIVVPAPPNAPFAIGDAGRGLRLVIGREEAWEVFDPCVPIAPAP